MQYVAAQPGAQQVQPVNVVIAGPSGAAGPPQYMAMPGICLFGAISRSNFCDMNLLKMELN